LSLFIQISLGYLLLVPQSVVCDQTYATWSTGSESNINEEGLERQKRRGLERGNWYKKKGIRIMQKYKRNGCMHKWGLLFQLIRCSESSWRFYLYEA